MNSQSPMMRRIADQKPTSNQPSNSTGHKITIPRKGRIRFVLALFFLFGCGFFVTKAVIKDNQKGATKTKTEKVAKNKKEKKQPISHKKDNENKKFEQSNNFLSFSDVSNLFSQNSIPLSNNTVSVPFQKDSAVLHLTIDTVLQEFCSKLMASYHPKYGAAAAIEPRTGRVLALVSYTNEGEPSFGDNLYAKSIFPAASVFKTITAAAAIETAHLNSNSPLRHTGRNHTLYKFQLEENLRGYKEIPLEEAFAFSINPVFARIGMYILGNTRLDNYGKKFGFHEPIPFELKNDSAFTTLPDSNCTMAELASGFNQVTTISPLFGSLLASAIVENGNMPRPYLVDSVTSKQNNACIYRGIQGVLRQPIKPQTAKELRIMMSQVAKYGTARKSFRYIKQSPRFDEFTYGGKTGSIDKDSVGRVDWFVGFARHPSDWQQRIAVGVVTVHGAYWTVHSSFIAAEMFRIYLRTLQEDRTPKEDPEREIIVSDTVENTNG